MRIIGTRLITFNRKYYDELPTDRHAYNKQWAQENRLRVRKLAREAHARRKQAA